MLNAIQHKILVDEISSTSMKESFADKVTPIYPPISLIDSPTVVISNITTQSNTVEFDYLCYSLYLSASTEYLASTQGHKSYTLDDIFSKEPNLTVTASTVASITSNYLEFTTMLTINYNNCVPTILYVDGYN